MHKTVRSTAGFCAFGALSIGTLLFSTVSCAPSADSEVTGEAALPLAHPGPWSIPVETLAVGDEQSVNYTGAGPWVGEEGCEPSITPGTDILRDYLYAHFPQTYLIGGYDCRPIVGNASQMSVHGTGRALDIMIPLDGGADNDAGDPIGNWLIENAEAIGIQFIIWDLYTWGASRPPGAKGKDYGGQHPHDDHLHIELSLEQSQNTTNWFEDLVEAPELEGCAPLAFDGGIIEETDDCFLPIGNSDFWRLQDDAGHGGSLLWTNAWENDEPSNWARWNMIFSSKGVYDVSVYVDPTWGVHQATRYTIGHADGETTIEVNQSEQQGWVSLGEYTFEAGAGQHVSVFDNALGPVAEDQHVVVDAVQLLRIGGYVPPDGLGVGSADDDDISEDGSGLPGNPATDDSVDDGGCSIGRVGSASSSGDDAPVWLLFGLGLAVWSTRRAVD